METAMQSLDHTRATSAMAPSGPVPFTDLRAMAEEIRPELEQVWARLLDQAAFIGGEAVERFESEWADYCGADTAVGVANGTDALWLTLAGLGIGPGDEVIVPANTFIATAEAVLLAGAIPRFADVDPDTLLLSGPTLEAALSERTAAVLVVHLYGQTPDMDAIAAVANRRGLAIIEDAAQAHGATWADRRAGSFGVAGAFSFYPGKNLGAFGDAGAVVTSDLALADRIRSLRNHGRALDSHHRHIAVGTNSRLDSLQAAVLSAKLARLDAWSEARRELMATYRHALAQSPLHLVREAPSARGVYHLAVGRVSHRDQLRADLASAGIETGVHYPIPCHQQEPYQRFATEPLPVAEQAAKEIISLPLYPHMTHQQVGQVCQTLHRLLDPEKASHA
jgi:dTDP-4-amino-4,6-dideoxygalactose transaminase